MGRGLAGNGDLRALAALLALFALCLWLGFAMGFLTGLLTGAVLLPETLAIIGGAA